MKKLITTLCLTALVTGAFAQGLVKFSNSATTLVTDSVLGSTTPAGAGQYFYGVFTAPEGTTDPFAFTFSGTYATNSVAGRFQGGLNTGIAVTGWAAGDTKSYFVAGWNAGMGHDYKPLWLEELLNNAAGDSGVFGISAIGVGVAGGTDPLGNSLPALVLFGASPSIATGFSLQPIPVPEPTTMALAGLGAAALLIFRRRK